MDQFSDKTECRLSGFRKRSTPVGEPSDSSRHFENTNFPSQIPYNIAQNVPETTDVFLKA